MFDDFDCAVTCEEFYDDGFFDDAQRVLEECFEQDRESANRELREIAESRY
jgi:hypothetical protein